MKLKLNDYKDGEIIKILREWSNLSQEELDVKINKNRRNIYDYEKGNYTYNMVTLRKIAKVLNLDIIIVKKINVKFK